MSSATLTLTSEEEDDFWQESLIGELQALKEKLETDVVSKVMLDVLSSIVDDLCLDLCVHVHESHQNGLLLLSGPSESRQHCIVDCPGYDVHGMIPEKVPKNEFFNCDNCSQRVGAAKYAAHLASCLGIGGRRRRTTRDASTSESGAGPSVAHSPSHARLLPSPPPVASTTPVPHPSTTPPLLSPSPLGRATHRPIDPGPDDKRAQGDEPSVTVAKRPRLDNSGLLSEHGE